MLLSLDERAHHRSPPATDNPINSGIFHVYAPPTLCCTFNVASTNIYRAIQRFFPPSPSVFLLFYPALFPFFSFFLFFFSPSSLLPYSIGCKSLTIVVGILAKKKLRFRKNRRRVETHYIFHLLLHFLPFPRIFIFRSFPDGSKPVPYKSNRTSPMILVY